MLPFSPIFRRYFKFWHLIARGLARIFAPRFHVSGRHNEPYRGGVIFVPNHTSDSDPFWVAAALRRRVWWMAKAEIWRDFPVAGHIMSFVETFPVEQKQMDRVALERSLEILKRGDALVIFPEGHCSPDGNLQALEPGVAMLALKSGAPVVPLGIAGAQQVLPYATIKPSPTLKSLRVHIGRAIWFDDLAAIPKREARKIALERIGKGINAAQEKARR